MKFAGGEREGLLSRRSAADALALCALLTLGAADAGSPTATLRIGLTVAVSCRVDSGSLTRRDSSEDRRKAAVTCGVAAPYAVNISTESPGAEVQRRLTDSQTPAGPVRVVTLVF